MKKNRKVLVNIDINSVTTPFLNRVAEGEKVSEAELYPFVDIYTEHGVTDLIFDIFCQYSATDSDVFSDYKAKYEQKTENGIEVNYHEDYKGIYRLNAECGIDPYEVWFRRCAEKGLRRWISVRMNDCHCPNDDAGFLRSDFFYEARENGWMVGEQYGYFRHCFDYSFEQVRRKMLDYIDEQLHRYDVDGLELDFQREMICFDYQNGKDHAPVMTEFIRNVKKIVAKHEELRGHKIEISLRLCRSIEDNLGFGFDVQVYHDEGLVDSVTPTARWSSHDSDMPLKDWMQRLPNIDIYAGIEALTNHRMLFTVPLVTAYIANCVSDEPYGIYFYNYFIDPGDTAELEYCNNALTLFETAASPIEEIVKAPLHHVVTFQDTCPKEAEPWSPLPKRLAKGQRHIIPIKTGVTPSRAATLILGTKADRLSDLDIYFNGKLLTGFSRLCEDEKIIYLGDKQRKNACFYEVPVTLESQQSYQQLEAVCTNGSVVLCYAEIDIL